MSDDWIHNLITIGVIALLFSWVPLVNVFWPPGWRSTRESSTVEKEHAKERPEKSTKRPAGDRCRSSTKRVPSALTESSLTRKEIMKTCAE
jgi:hypothetical protein